MCALNGNKRCALNEVNYDSLAEKYTNSLRGAVFGSCLEGARRILEVGSEG
jgi:hypothetical protein